MSAPLPSLVSSFSPSPLPQDHPIIRPSINKRKYEVMLEEREIGGGNHVLVESFESRESKRPKTEGFSSIILPASSSSSNNPFVQNNNNAVANFVRGSSESLETVEEEEIQQEVDRNEDVLEDVRGLTSSSIMLVVRTAEDGAPSVAFYKVSGSILVCDAISHALVTSYKDAENSPITPESFDHGKSAMDNHVAIVRFLLSHDENNLSYPHPRMSASDGFVRYFGVVAAKSIGELKFKCKKIKSSRTSFEYAKPTDRMVVCYDEEAYSI